MKCCSISNLLSNMSKTIEIKRYKQYNVDKKKKHIVNKICLEFYCFILGGSFI